MLSIDLLRLRARIYVEFPQTVLDNHVTAIRI